MTCPICLEDDVKSPVTLMCSHVLCLVCWNNCKRRKVEKCPVCRKPCREKPKPKQPKRKVISKAKGKSKTTVKTRRNDDFPVYCASQYSTDSPEDDGFPPYCVQDYSSSSSSSSDYTLAEINFLFS